MSFLDPAFFFFVVFAVAFYHLLSRLNRSAGVSLLQTAFLLAVSLVFYGWFRPEYLLLIAVTALTAWSFGRFFPDPPLYVFVLFLAACLFPLILFKYSDFLILSAKHAGLLLNAELLSLSLPLGISFFTFQNVSYLTDRFRKTQPPEKSFLRYFLYISFFPQLVAGPIVTAGKFFPNLNQYISFSRLPLREAMLYLVSGYVKKAVLADRLALYADPVFAEPSAFSWAALYPALLAYTMQIYFDFSGYSDIALGCGRLFGIRLPENFNAPYSAAGFRDFWRRWHITLSVWLRDHIYIPMGGSRFGLPRMAAALVVTMFLGGLWHGAHWNFALWGLLHGFFLVLDRKLPFSGTTVPAIRYLYTGFTFFTVACLWVLFRTGSEVDGFQKAMDMYSGMISLQGGLFPEKNLKFVWLSFILLILSSYFSGMWDRFCREADDLSAAALGTAAVIAVVLASPGSSSFIYFIF